MVAADVLRVPFSSAPMLDMTGLTSRLAEFVAAAVASPLPERCREAITLGFTDCVGVALAGSAEPASRIAASLIPASSAADCAHEFSSGRPLAAADAALVNGTAAHALDYDDVSLGAHPSAVLVPAILAAGSLRDVSGRKAMLAYAIGYEVWALLDSFAPGRLHARGFHPTAVLGTIAAAAACSSLNSLSAVESRCALGISASLASGLVANFGTMTKPLHAGRAAQSGVLAAQLAAAGFTAAAEALEQSTGFLAAHSMLSESPAVALKRLERLGADWTLGERGLDIKRYPTCYATHRCIDAMLSLREEHGLHPEAVETIHVIAGANQLRILSHAAPQNALEAKFSMPFAMASALAAGRVGLTELRDEFVRRQEIQRLLPKVQCTPNPERMPGDEFFAPHDTVSVTLTSGARLSHPPIAHALGSWSNPLSRKELGQKFFECSTGRLSPSRANLLFDQLTHLEDVESVRTLFAPP
jgi:2-methylcitrate dehydratase PrpD